MRPADRANRVVGSHVIARRALAAAGVFALIALGWGVVVLMQGGSWWGPLHAFLAGTVVLAISGASQMFTITWAAAPAPPAWLARLQLWLVVAGVIAVTDPETTIDVYMGSGGAPEGVLAAAALRCVGGQFQGKLIFRNNDEKARAEKWGVEDFDRIYNLEDLASGDVIFAATGVTDGSLLDGVKRFRDRITTESVVMRASTGTVRWVKGEHRTGAHWFG